MASHPVCARAPRPAQLPGDPTSRPLASPPAPGLRLPCRQPVCGLCFPALLSLRDAVPLSPIVPLGSLALWHTALPETPLTARLPLRPTAP